MMVEFIYCKNFATAEQRSVPWDKFAEGLTRSVEFANKEASKKRGAFIGGTLIDPKRNRADNNIARRTSVTIDLDRVTMPLDDIELFLRLDINITLFNADQLALCMIKLRRRLDEVRNPKSK